MRAAFTVLLGLIVSCCWSQLPQRNRQLQNIDTLRLDLKSFADSITGNEKDAYQKARKLLYWLSSNFEWKATDYQTRTVNQIIARNGGNCFELAKVYMAFIKEAGIPYRGITEINIHTYTPRRQATAAEMVKQRGNTASVFGLQHNDHRWVEIYDSNTGAWQPADPSMGVIGLADWLKARVWFGERRTIDTAITNHMIVPFVIFTVGANGRLEENRTNYYLIESFNQLYGGKLALLPEWKEWTEQVSALTEPAKNAFMGKENLHNHQDAIARLSELYGQLKRSYLQKYRQ